MNGYETYISNLKYGKEGIFLAVKNKSYNEVYKVYESESGNLTTFEIILPKITFRAIVLHGPQESEALEIREEFFNNLDVEIERALSSDSKLLIAGDFNSKLVNDEGEEQGNASLMRKLLSTHHLTVLNFAEKTVCKWTRIHKRRTETIKSVLDYLIVDQTILDLVLKTTIDEEKVYTPYRIKIKKEKLM